MIDNEKNIKTLEQCLVKIEEKTNGIYFLCYDTRGNARASVKYIYDLALTLKDNGYKTYILVEDKTYKRPDWLPEKYNDLEVLSIKDDQPQLKFEDLLVIPEYYNNALEQLVNVPCNKVMLIQQKEFIYETLPLGTKFSDYGIFKMITTTNTTKKYLMEYFPESLVFVVPPIIEDVFKKSEKMQKPYIALSIRNRTTHKKIISEFYIRYPQYRWLTFRDMVQMTQEDFALGLRECFVSVWIDDDSTFGTFPLESMKSNVPVIGKYPKNDVDWLTDGKNGIWTDNENDIVEILGTYCYAWVNGIDFKSELYENMTTTLEPYNTTITQNNILNIFDSLNSKRKELINNKLTALKGSK
jgi:hypothetical protein